MVERIDRMALHVAINRVFNPEEEEWQDAARIIAESTRELETCAPDYVTMEGFDTDISMAYGFAHVAAGRYVVSRSENSIVISREDEDVANVDLRRYVLFFREDGLVHTAAIIRYEKLPQRWIIKSYLSFRAGLANACSIVVFLAARLITFGWLGELLLYTLELDDFTPHTAVVVHSIRGIPLNTEMSVRELDQWI